MCYEFNLTLALLRLILRLKTDKKLKWRQAVKAYFKAVHKNEHHKLRNPEH